MVCLLINLWRTELETIESYLRLDQILKIIPVSRSTWYRGMKTGLYPKQVRLSYRVAAWKSSEVKECLARLGTSGDSSLQNPPNHS